MSKEFIRIIGDCHGKMNRFLPLLKDVPFSVQLGDMDLNYSKIHGLDATRHRFIPGNHDNYDSLPANALQHDFGPHAFFNKEGKSLWFYFVRGASSIDALFRDEGKSWWRNEELDVRSLYAMLEEYCAVKPEIMMTHTCPASVANKASNITSWGGRSLLPDRTSQFLELCWRYHQPKVWYFGHFHTNYQMSLIPDKCPEFHTRWAENPDWTPSFTRFRCVAELAHVDIDFEGNEL